MPDKSMDFFRPTRSTDPLVSRPRVQSVSAPVSRPKTPSASVQPTLRSGSGVAPKSQFSRPNVASSSVSVQKTVVKKTTPTSVSTSVTSRVSSSVSAKSPAPKLDKDDWFDSLEKSGFLSDDAPRKEKSPYSSGSESPFLKSVKVEKRPLSNSTPKSSPYDRPEFGKKKPTPKKDPVRIVNKSKKKSNALSLVLIIIVTIILGVAAGVGVFFFIAG